MKITVEFTCARCGENLKDQTVELDPAGLAICASHVDEIAATIPDADWTEEAYDRLIQAMIAEGDIE